MLTKPEYIGKGSNRNPKIAIVHEWLVTYAGSEKVLSEMLKEFPDADVFCLFDFSDGKFSKFYNGKVFKTSFLQGMRVFRKMYRNLLPLMALAVEQFDLSDYDIVISNSHAVAKGVITAPNQLHICYCYTPMRYAWDLQHQYLREQKIDRGLRAMVARWMLHRTRIWDLRTVNGVDSFIACSEYIARRIRKFYRRDAAVIYPGVDTDYFQMGGEKKDFYLTSSRLVPYKKIGLIVEAFRHMPDKKLVVIGDGPQYRDAVERAGPNVSVLGYQEDAVLLRHLQEAKAFIFAAEEDFGIAPIEAQACGTPVLAYGRGGASETVVDGVTGLHFWEQSVEAICDAVDRFERMVGRFDAAAIRQHACRFSNERFRVEFRDHVNALWNAHCAESEVSCPKVALPREHSFQA
ncbi:glycosyltransferase family 4 protein [Consotaella salsifontis]|uniref:Glycosyltransferase involved in cell wall bisynthesis n=1 Tax=Consotaella salsifontis TaxID=1365950 RepID=A0A1T4SXN1_9HYPH|nr:glycosyltransferase family 4 protein [Consotaella salsifontis]SKA32967.1 Glycosyltransferase involved in cell wall bisynthesis [Consotaella salsifontis]